MSSLEIRPTAAADLPFITGIYEHAVLQGTATFELIPPDLAEMTRRFAVLMEGGFPYFVAVLDGRVIGYAYAGAYRPRPAYRFTVENSVYLEPAIHRRGIGLQLLERLITECEARGYRQMIAVIGDSDNAGSISVHTKCGFEMIGTHPNVGFKFGRWSVPGEMVARRCRPDSSFRGARRAATPPRACDRSPAARGRVRGRGAGSVRWPRSRCRCPAWAPAADLSRCGRSALRKRGGTPRTPHDPARNRWHSRATRHRRPCARTDSKCD